MNKKLYISMLLIMMPALAFSAQVYFGRGQVLLEKERRIALALLEHKFYITREAIVVAKSQEDPVRLQIAQQNFLQVRFELREADPEHIIFEGNQVLKRYVEKHGPDTWHPL